MRLDYNLFFSHIYSANNFYPLMKEALRFSVIYKSLSNNHGSIHDMTELYNNEMLNLGIDKSVKQKVMEIALNNFIKIYSAKIKYYKPDENEINNRYSDLKVIQKGNRKYRIKNYPTQGKNVDIDGRISFIKFIKVPELILSDDEIKHIDQISLMFSRFAGLEGFEWIDDMKNSSTDLMGLDLKSSNKISYEERLAPGSKKHYDLIRDALFNENLIKIKRINNNAITSLDFSPHFLKLFKNKWYVFGHVPNQVYPYVVPVDKSIRNVETSKYKYVDSEIDFRDKIDFNSDINFFDKFIGVTNKGSYEKIIFKVHDENSFLRIDKKPPHYSYEQIKDDKNYMFSLKVKLNPELNRFILENIDCLEVLSPQKLRDSIRVILDKSSSKYR